MEDLKTFLMAGVIKEQNKNIMGLCVQCRINPQRKEDEYCCDRCRAKTFSKWF